MSKMQQQSRPTKTTAGQTTAMGVAEGVTDYLSIAAPFGHALVAAARKNSKIVGLTADLGKYTDIHPFRDAFPERFYNIGMAEQNLIGVAAGMARVGLVPFCTTYCVFATRRAYDFIAIGCALSKTNVKIIAGLPGLTTGYGGTHQGIEDLALMRAIPGLVVIDPADATDIAQATAAIAEYDGPVYMRLLRAQVPQVLDPASYKFAIGKATRLRSGTDLAIISTGLMTPRALETATALASQGISATVLHVPTLKPLDEAAIATVAREVPLVISAENHVIRGGLGTAIADVLVEQRINTRLVKVGIPDAFIECGSLPYLQDKYGLTTERLTATALTALKK